MRCYQMVDWLHTTCSVLIPDLFRTYSRPFQTKKHKATTPPYSTPIPTKRTQSNNNYSAPIPTKKHKATAQLFRTFSNKENTKQRPGTEIGVEAGADCSARRRTL